MTATVLKKRKWHRYYFVLALMWGLIMVFLVPPFQVPDEEAHVRKAQAISRGQVVCEDGTVDVSEEELNFIDEMDPNRIIFDEGTTFEWVSPIEYENRGRETKMKEVASPVCAISPVAHVIPAGADRIGNFLHANELTIFYMMRVANLLLGISIMSLAIKIIPSGKRIIFVLGLLPVTLFLMASVNYDAFFIPVLMLYIAYVFNGAFKKTTISFTEMGVLVVLSLCITTTKLAYLPLLFLPILFGAKRFPHVLGSRRLGFFVYIATLLLINIGAVYLFQRMAGSMTAPEWVDPGGQISFILHQPVDYLVILTKSLFWNLPWYIITGIGQLGWLDYRISSVSYILVIVMGSLFVLGERYQRTFQKWQRSVIFALIAAMIALIMTGMFIYSTHTRSHIIEGAQGRYFIPSVLLLSSILLPLIPKRWIQSLQGLHMVIIGAAAFVFVAVDTIWQTIVRYYL